MSNLTFVSPSFIVANLQHSISFYTGMLGFEVRFMGPPPPGDPYFAIVGRDKISIFLKEIAADIKPVPNHTRHQDARWDAYISTEEPDKLFQEYQTRGVIFHQPLKVDDDRLLGFEVEDADGYMLFF